MKLFQIGVLMIVTMAGPSFSDVPYFINCRDEGAVGDGVADDSAAIQSALNKAGQQAGGVVLLPAGTYRINSKLSVPSGVTLQGIWNTPHHEDQTWGSALFAYSGKGQSTGAALVTLSPSSSIRGLKIFYPEQSLDSVSPYPYAIRGSGMECAVENVTLVNAYQGIDFSQQHELHTIRNVRGCVLKQGIIIDRCTDIGRIENVHFNPHYWQRAKPGPGYAGFPAGGWEKLVDYVNTNLDVFIFARSDWEYVLNTFAWGFKTCYKFINAGNGACNGNFLGIGADGGQYCVWVEQTQPPGLLITNGEFVAFSGTNPIEILTTPGFTGVVQLTNCSFWGPAKRCVYQQGNGLVSLNQCNFQDWGAGDTSLPAVEVVGGELTVLGSFFARNQKGIRVGASAKTAILDNNRFRGTNSVEYAKEQASSMVIE
ncbi:MAG: Pectate lyase superfamily protein [Candidatus Hinthialibacteria bacterium OLB16]|nr:MAG: Pectate lyase superfamily protein [Candidatus Hinthialibacteria bacterium OLB16]